jgi:sugar/nucleoside kinase (ribokinase family)
MSSPDILVAGHVCLDVIPTFSEQDGKRLFEPGTLLEVGGPVLATGGAVSNVGLALHRLGVPVRLAAKIGDDLFGHAILKILRDHDERLAAELIVSAADATSYTIVLSPPGTDRIFLHSPGANATFDPREIDRGLFSDVRVLHFGYPPIMAKTYDDEGEELARLFSDARKEGLAVSLDMAQIDPNAASAQVNWMGFLERVLPHVDVFGPSIGELRDMMGRADGGLRQGRAGGCGVGTSTRVKGGVLVETADHLLALGAALVVLKLGSNGIFLRTSADRARLAAAKEVPLDDRWLGRTLLQPCFLVDVAGTTGAGDCTLAGFLTALLKGRSPEECLRSAAAVGACSVEQEDSTSGVPAWEDVQARLDRGWPLREVMLDLQEWRWNERLTLWAAPGDGG